MMTLYSCNIKKADENIQTEKIIEKIKSPEPKTVIDYSELLNVELVGLTKYSKNNKRFYVDFSSACFCNSPSILLKEKKFIYLVIVKIHYHHSQKTLTTHTRLFKLTKQTIVYPYH